MLTCISIGHTHEKVDQFFSVVSKKLESEQGKYIVTPLGMQAFIQTVVASPSHGYRVYCVKTCDSVYDFKSAIFPYFNKAIKNYTVSKIQLTWCVWVWCGVVLCGVVCL